MSRLLGSLFFAAIAFVTALPVSSAAETINGLEYEQTEGVWFVLDENEVAWQIAPSLIHVQFGTGVLQAQIDTFATNHHLTSSPVLVPGGFRRFSYEPEADPIDILSGVLLSPIVTDAELDRYVVIFGAPNDDLYMSNQWNLERMNLERAWDVTTGSSPVTIAIFDQGVDPDHYDLYATKWANPNDAPDDVDNDDDAEWYGQELVDDTWGWDFVNGNNDPVPSGPHGTAVAGVAIAVRDNNEGVAGVAGGSSASRPIKWASVIANTQFTTIDGLRYCRHKGFQVINFSVGFDDFRGTASHELDSLYTSGALMFGASGNYGSGVAFPASHAGVIAIGALDDEDLRWYYSGTGSKLELSAPSGDIDQGGSVFVATTDNEGGANYPDYEPDEFYFLKFGGTSAACPAAAGVGALLLSYNPGLTNIEARAVLARAAIDLGSPGRDTVYGHGRVDAYKTMTQWGTIASDTTWGEPGSAMTVYVSGDLTIAAGKTLTIEPGTVIRIASDDNLRAGADTTRVEVNVEGFLEVAGTALDPIVIEGWDDEESNEWVGIYLDEGSDGASFDHCIIRNAEYGIESWTDITIMDCVIKDCDYAGVVLQDGELILDDTVIRGSTWGVFLTSSSAELRGVTLRDCVSAGVHVQPSADLTAKACTFRGNDVGVYINDTADVTIDSLCAFKQNDIGIYCYSTNVPAPLIQASVIDSNATAIYCDHYSHPTINDNTLRYNGTGVYCVDYSEPLITGNTITNNTVGIGAASDADPNLGHTGVSGQNTIHTSSSHHVANLTVGLTVKAEDNWWNSGAGPHPSKISGSVDKDPYLTSAPSLMFSLPVPEVKFPQAFAIGTIAPNPFNPTTVISYQVPQPGARISMRIYDVAGRLVRELLNTFQPAGSHQIAWDGTTNRGETAASAVYFIEMRAPRFSQSKKLVLLK